MSIELGRRLLASELITRENVRDALLLSELRGISFPRALIERGIVTEAELDDEIARLAGSGLRYVQGSAELVAKLPRSLPRRLSALPTRTDPQTGVVDVAAADPFDPHVETEISFHLKSSVRVLRAPIAAVEEAIRRIEAAMDGAPADAAPRPRRLTPALPYGAPGSIPPPAPSTPIPLIVKRTIASPSSLDDADTYVDDFDPHEEPDGLGQTAGWGTAIPRRDPLPSIAETDEPATLGRTAAWGAPAAIRPALPVEAEADESAALGRTAAWGAPAPVRPAEPVEAEEDESAALGRTAAWGAPAPVRDTLPTLPEGSEPAALGRTAGWGAPVAVRPAVPVALEADESASLGRTAAWGAPARRVATLAPAQPLGKTLGFEEEPPPRVSFPSTPPAGHDSVPPPLGFAPPEVSAWKGLSNAVLRGVAVVTPSPSIEDDPDIETTFVSAQDELPSLPSSVVDSGASTPTPVEEQPAALSAAPTSLADGSFDEFDDVPQRPTLVDFPPQASTMDAKSLIGAIAVATNRDDIVELAFRCMSLIARRAALFSAKRNGFHGWLCNEAFGSSDTLRQVVIPNDKPSIMATAAATSLYLGPLPPTTTHEPLLAVMGKASGDVAVASVRVGGKVAAMLVCDELRDTLSGTRRMDELARAMGDALTRLVKTRG